MGLSVFGILQKTLRMSNCKAQIITIMGLLYMTLDQVGRKKTFLSFYLIKLLRLSVWSIFPLYSKK